jgi:hypothetical protein
LIVIKDDPEVLPMFREAMKGQAGRPKTGSNPTLLEKDRGKAYTLTRLQKDNPEEDAKKASRSARAAEMVKAGTHTQAEAGIECGISQQAVSKALNTTTQKVTAPKVVARKPPQPTIKLAEPHRGRGEGRKQGVTHPQVSRRKARDDACGNLKGGWSYQSTGHAGVNKTAQRKNINTQHHNPNGGRPPPHRREHSREDGRQLTQSTLCEPRRTPR